MPKLVTTIPVEKSAKSIEPGAGIITLGSCFATKLSTSLSNQGFLVNHNPFGTLYTPSAITTPLLLALHPEYHYSDEDLFLEKGIHHALAFAYSYRSDDPKKLLFHIEKETDKLARDLSKASHIIITLGTAWQYYLDQDHTGVGNCHQLPHTYFTREITPVEEIVSHLKEVVQEVTDTLPKIQIILTVSPVRHLRDNPLENSRSKASLLLAAQEIALDFECVNYFPAYEIMMDELRDYRFYTDDLVHPSPLAEEIIFERFSEAYLSPRAQDFIQAYGAIKKARAHVVQKPSRAKVFGEQLFEKVVALEKKFPEVSLKEDKDYFSSLIH